MSVCLRKGSRGFRISLKLVSSPSASGQKAGGMMPLGLKMKTMRCFRLPWLANPRLGRFSTNGTAAALKPRSRMNSRRLRVIVIARLQAEAVSTERGASGSVSQLRVLSSLCPLCLCGYLSSMAAVTAISTTSLRILKPLAENDFRSSSGRFTP